VVKLFAVDEIYIVEYVAFSALLEYLGCLEEKVRSEKNSTAIISSLNSIVVLNLLPCRALDTPLMP
jgi:hypothetical protein